MNQKIIYSILPLLIVLLSCKSTKSSSVSNILTNDQIVVTWGSNTGNEKGDQNELQSLHLIIKMLKGSSDQYSIPTKAQTNSEILSAISKAAEKLTDSSTLYWFHIGHGGPGGIIGAVDSDGYLSFEDIIETIKKTRSNFVSTGEKDSYVPFKRFVIIINSCFSGNLVEKAVDSSLRITQQVIAFSSAPTSTYGYLLFPYIYSSLYFFNQFKQNPNLSLDEVVSNTNNNYQSQGWDALYRYDNGKVFKMEGQTSYEYLIFFQSANPTSFAITNSRISDFIRVDNSYGWKQITLSNKTNPTWVDIRNLVDLMGAPQVASQVYSYPEGLKYSSVYNN